MSYQVRPMRREDTVQVTDIDREAFPTLWPPANYQRELHNRLAHYLVTCDTERTVAEPEVKASPEKGFSRLLYKAGQLFNHNLFFGDELPLSGREYVAGFIGIWIMADEAHIIAIAVRETYRHRGIGELLLISMIDLIAELNTRLITLEVRASNTEAQSLYHKYGFTQVGVRRSYYSDNHEDGVLMSTEDITSAKFQAHLQQLKQAHSQKWRIPLYQIVR